MASFVRGNKVICSGTFKAANGDDTQPGAAELLLRYADVNGDPTEEVLEMTMNPTSKVWSAEWDSRLSAGGPVEWVIRSVIGLQAATQGQFTIKANAANIADYD